MIGLPSLEVYYSFSDITEKNNKFEINTDFFEGLSFTELKDDVDEILGLSDIPPEYPQDKLMGPRIFEAYQVLSSEKRQTVAYIMLLMGNARSPFREFEKYLRIVVGLDTDDIQLFLKHYVSNFVTYEKPPAIY